MPDVTRARIIPNFPAYYATPDGKVFTTYRGWRELTQSRDRHGYQSVCVYRADKTRARIAVHTAILSAFAGPKPTPTAVCRHLNGNRTDNRAENLAWGTQSENIADAIGHGTAHQIGRRGEQASRAKLTRAQVFEIERRARSGCEYLHVIGRDFGISTRHVASIRDHMTWRHLWEELEV